MTKSSYKFTASTVSCFPGGVFNQLKKIVSPAHAILITDENIYKKHAGRFKGWNVIILKPGEEYKVQATADGMIEKLISMQADRSTTLIGVGGGVVTDLTGYVASIYMRGISFGFVPTTVLGMVDASIGGKNGVDVGVYKNMAGVIRQPSFLFYDATFLDTLPVTEWENGFAEIIKHACIRVVQMFRALEKNSLTYYRNNHTVMSALIRKNMQIKMKIVQQDEFEKGDRKLLNFGHTLGHALENQYELSHGQAISIGMTFACHLSAQETGFRDTEKVVALLEKYNLPTYASFNKTKVYNVLIHDKKKVRKELHFVLLDKIGKGVVKPVTLKKVERMLDKF